MKKVILPLILLKASVVFAQVQQDYRYALFYYNIGALEGSQLSDSDCQNIFKEELYYNIDTGQSPHEYDYKENENYAVKSYKRISNIKINNDQMLYSGKGLIDLGRGSDKKQAEYSESFIHDSSQSMIQGIKQVKGYCKMSMIGIDVLKNKNMADLKKEP